MKLAVLTYQTKHRKTFDVLCLLKANGYIDVHVFAIPFHYKKVKFPIYQHRPEMNYSIPEIDVLCCNFGYEYSEGCLESFNIENDRIVLVAGAGLLPEDFISSHIVINSHPGYIPNCRGLDAFKWAIYEKQPMGVTTHIIGKHVDAGDIIERRTINVYDTDSFHALAQRVYENEVSMLIESLTKINEISEVLPGEFELHKRMPADIEKHLMEDFIEYKNAFGIKRDDF